ncbi:MAG TPA: YggT family protein [Candidatus Limnocylindria bacterium]|nr:YggT family protein [Candidatus Limnocylindria bacterium]
MTYRTDVDVVEPAEPGYVAPAVVEPAYRSTRVTRYSSSPLATVQRFIVFIFGLIEAVIVLRIILLLLAAREGNDVVQFVYGVSELFVAPFRGILRIDEVQAGIAALDFGAIVALVFWVIIELIVLAALRVFRPSATA